MGEFSFPTALELMKARGFYKRYLLSNMLIDLDVM